MIIDENNETVEFRTTTPYFEKERDGLKNNTVRVFTNECEEARFVSSLFNLSKIRIRNANGDSFERLITDISVMPTIPSFIQTTRNNIYIISWEGR